jgi:hypothetical protein
MPQNTEHDAHKKKQSSKDTPSQALCFITVKHLRKKKLENSVLACGESSNGEEAAETATRHH